MLVVLFIEALYAFGLVFTVCELCQNVSDIFNEIDVVINEFDWLSFPIEIQRLLPIVIITEQQPIDFKFFGSITSSRESFKQVSSID